MRGGVSAPDNKTGRDIPTGATMNREPDIKYGKGRRHSDLGDGFLPNYLANEARVEWVPEAAARSGSESVCV